MLLRSSISSPRVCARWLVCACFATASLAAAAADALESVRALLETGRFAEAQAALERVPAAGELAGEVHFLRGELALQRNAPAAAVECFEAAVAAAPAEARYHHRLGDAYGRAAQVASVFRAYGLARKCVAAYERAVALDPGNVDARFSLWMYYRSAPAIVGGGRDKAAAQAAALAQRDPACGALARAALHVSAQEYGRARAELAARPARALSTVAEPAVYLSEVAWDSARVGWGEPARSHGWFGPGSPPTVVLIVHGRLYRHALYAHAESRYTYALAGRWRTLTATVGLRDGAHPQGSAIFLVRGDGRELYRSPVLRVGESTRLRLDVSGVRELELSTLGGEGHVHHAWAVWAAPRLER